MESCISAVNVERHDPWIDRGCELAIPNLRARRQTGNFPRALTHIALINTAHNLCAAKTPTEKPAVQRSR